MTGNILNAINTARKVFEIESFPGDFFEHLMMDNYTDRCRLLLFKEDIDKLSGFIGYGMNGFAVICVNYKRPMGHQNFTLAHEVGHWLLHREKSISDDDKVLGYTSDSIEKEANEFADKIRTLEKPNSPDREYFMAEISKVFTALASSEDLECLYHMMPYKEYSFSEIKGQYGIYVFVSKEENRNRKIQNRKKERK